MSHITNDIEKKMSNIGIGSLSSYILSEDYKNIFFFLTQSRADQLKLHLKEILITLKTEIAIHKFLLALIDVLKSDSGHWKNPEPIKSIFNELDQVYLQVFSVAATVAGAPQKPDQKSLNNTHQQKFHAILESVFSYYFNEVDKQLQKIISNAPSGATDSPNNHQSNSLYALSSTLLGFTNLLDIAHYEPILFPMAQFAERLLRQYNGVVTLQPLTVEFLLHINHRLVNYLAVVPGNAVSKGLKESIFVYSTVRSNIVSLNYSHPEIITKALCILEHRSRFFGLTADAIPENENHGDYIVVDPLNSAFEDDDVYDDYERFLANLPGGN